MRVYATHQNAGLLGSRFVGECEIGTDEGEVWLTGHRMPVALVRARALCDVLLVPWIFIAIAATVATVDRDPISPYLVAATIALFAMVAAVLVGGDLWAARRARIETVSWRPEEATAPRPAVDQTASFGALGSSLLARATAGRCVTQVRAPIGPDGSRVRVVLRSELSERHAVAQILSGGSIEQGARADAPNVVA
jgi:hypothetical protein